MKDLKEECEGRGLAVSVRSKLTRTVSAVKLISDLVHFVLQFPQGTKAVLIARLDKDDGGDEAPPAKAAPARTFTNW